LNEIAQGYLWMWCENQVAAAVKLVPLGQTAGQKMLLALADVIPAAVETGLQLNDDAIGMSAPGLGIASALHESQYSRLFRS
jgi:urease accessory protein